MKICLLVLGMHRSGTSALAGALNCAGVSFGKELAAPAPDNPKGFFESKAVLQFNNQYLLPFLGRKWWTPDPMPPAGWELGDAIRPLVEEAKNIIEEEFAGDRVFGLKDPRICLLAPFWLRVLRELGISARVILPYRSPHEVAGSLRKRNSMSWEQGVTLWAEHLIAAELNSRGLLRCFLTYDQLLSDPWTVIDNIRQAFQIEWVIAEGVIRERLSAFIDGALRHHDNSAQDSERQSYPRAIRDLAAFYEGGTISACDEPRLITQLDALYHQLRNEREFYLSLNEQAAQKLELFGVLEGEAVAEPLCEAWVDTDERVQTVELFVSGGQGWEGFRVYMPRAASILAIEELSLVVSGSQESTSLLGALSTNAAYRQENVYFFDKPAPLLKLESVADGASMCGAFLRFRFRYLGFGEGAGVASSAVRKLRDLKKKAQKNAATQSEVLKARISSLSEELRSIMEERSCQDRDLKVLRDQFEITKTELDNIKAELGKERRESELRQKMWRGKLDSAVRELSDLRAELTAVHASRSWRITRPLRAASKFTRKVFP